MVYIHTRAYICASAVVCASLCVETGSVYRKRNAAGNFRKTRINRIKRHTRRRSKSSTICVHLTRTGGGGTMLFLFNGPFPPPPPPPTTVYDAPVRIVFTLFCVRFHLRRTHRSRLINRRYRRAYVFIAVYECRSQTPRTSADVTRACCKPSASSEILSGVYFSAVVVRPVNTGIPLPEF